MGLGRAVMGVGEDGQGIERSEEREVKKIMKKKKINKNII